MFKGEFSHAIAETFNKLSCVTQSKTRADISIARANDDSLEKHHQLQPQWTPRLDEDETHWTCHVVRGKLETYDEAGLL